MNLLSRIFSHRPTQPALIGMVRLWQTQGGTDSPALYFNPTEHPLSCFDAMEWGGGWQAEAEP